MKLQNLNKISVLNILSKEDVDKLWKPQLTFRNTFRFFCMIYDEEVFARVIKETEPLPTNFFQAKESKVLYYGKSYLPSDVTLFFLFYLVAWSFDPTKNSIMMTREYFLDYRCYFDFTYIPFDTQVC